MELEDQFDIKIADEQAEKIATVGDAVKFIAENALRHLRAEPTALGQGVTHSHLAVLAESLPSGLLVRALTHSSWVQESTESYERLEFLGDSVLGLAMASHLFNRFPGWEEGELAKLRAFVVSRRSCGVVARRIGVPELVLSHAPVDEGRREDIAEGTATLGNMLEALIGACFLEHGYSETAEAIVEAFAEQISFGRAHDIDHKSTLQELLAARDEGAEYMLVEQEGPSHDPCFTTEVSVDGKVLGRVPVAARRKVSKRPLGRHWVFSEPCWSSEMTYLRSIRLRGFKTFARSTEMLFEPGVTVVIGPNGSGKSNITDAVLWVLGEQSPTQLRGRNMQDVIFAGSDGRRRAPFAEVALVLDNSRGNLPTEFTEVEVGRRLQRDGSSEYRLNGAACRLLDVQELLSSAGLGLEGAVRTALRPLKAQVRAAERHAELSEKLADARTRVLLQELDGLDSRTRKVKSREESVRERQKKGEAELKDVRLQRETEENRFAEVLADRDVATADYHRAKGDLDRLTARGEAVERRLAGLRTEVERAERQRTSVEAALADVENRLMVLRDMPDHTSGRLEAVENVATAVTEEARALRPEMEADERKAEELRDLILEQESARSRIQQSLELLEQEKQDLGRRGDKAAEQVEVARNRKSEAEGAVEALRTQVEDARKNVSTSREEVMAKENELSAASSVAQETRSLVRDGKKELESAQTRLQVLRDALARRDGISDSARHLLDSISGAQLVTDALRVPEGLEKALSVALGPLAQGVLIPLEGREEDAVAFLGQGAGSVEVLCPDGSDSEDRSQSSPPVGRSLWEEVDGPEEVVRFLAQLLPSTALVEDLTAVSAAALAAGWRCIDAAGQVIEGPGHAARRA